MLENNNKLLWKHNNRNENISYWVIAYFVGIALIFITIGLIFPNDFSLLNIPGLGIINYVIILYLFGTIGFLHTSKKKNFYSVNTVMKRKKGE